MTVSVCPVPYSDLLFQALKTEMVQFLVRLLEMGLEAQESPAATKAQVVKALKAMQKSLKFGDTVRTRL